MAELVSRRVLRAFEDTCAGWGTLRTIQNAFEDEHFDVTAVHDDGTRRGLFNALVSRVDLRDAHQTARLIRVLETILSWVPTHDPLTGETTEPFLQLQRQLERDGYNIDPAGRIQSGALRAATALPLEHLRDPSTILEHLQRLERSGADDPALAISSAKALVEATTKHVLEELGEGYGHKADIPELVKSVQKALKLHPETIAPTTRGRDTIVRILSNLSQVAIGVAELRNEYGPDHGRTRGSSGLGPRHAHLAVGAAATYCRMLLETLAYRRTVTGEKAGPSGAR